MDKLNYMELSEAAHIFISNTFGLGKRVLSTRKFSLIPPIQSFTKSKKIFLTFLTANSKEQRTPFSTTTTAIIITSQIAETTLC